MYTVYCDNSILYTPGVEELKLGDPVLKLEVNKTGSFSFTIYPDHLYYDQIERMKSIVRVEKDGSTLFRGRVISEEIGGTAERPRMSVYRSNAQISVQLIDDKAGKTLLSVSSLCKEIAEKKGNKTEQAAFVGAAVAEKAKAAGIEAVVFDRNGYLYHGRVKALADAARNGGLNF